MALADKDIRRRLQALGEQLAAQRLSRNLTQRDLAREAGTSVNTVRRLEAGENASLEVLVRVLDALKLADRLEALAPPVTARPVDRVRLGGAERRRASPRKSQAPGAAWTWGDRR